MEEIWKDIVGYEGLYQVSNCGRVKSLSRYMNNKNGGKSLLKERILKSAYTKKGYLRVGLCKYSKTKPFSVHRLVAQAFIPNPNNLPQVNHKDENKENNFVYINEDGTADLEKSNLEWCTNEYNSNYGTKNERLAFYKIDIFTKEGVFIETWTKGINSLAKKYHISSKSCVRNCLFPYLKKGRSRKYINKYAGDYCFKLHTT